jgi:hypothetical protein
VTVRIGGDNRPVVDAADELERGREAYSAGAWVEAYESLSASDRSDPLGPETLPIALASETAVRRATAMTSD